MRLLMIRNILVCGAGGFIGHHLVRRLKAEGNRVHGVDLKFPRYTQSEADEFSTGDLRDAAFVHHLFKTGFDEVYQLAADMGGAGYVFTGDNDAAIMRNSALINMNVLETARISGCERIFYSSSACVYPERSTSAHCVENEVYPASPDSDYGWEKLFSERLYAAYARNFGMNVRIARYHNIFGPEGAWNNGREKAPAAICRKVALAGPNQSVEIWGDGTQLRSFLYIDQCIEGTIRLMRSDFAGPVNIGSDRMISIDALTDLVAEIGGKSIVKTYVDGPLGVRARCSDNHLIGEELGWAPDDDLRLGLEATYRWIAGEIAAGRADTAESAS